MCSSDLTADSARPFLAVADLCNPHDICNWVGVNAGPHEDVTPPGYLPPLPDNFRDLDPLNRPRSVQYICCAHNRQSQVAQWTEANFRHYLAAYYHYVARVDTEIGLILAALENSDEFDNTMIVFMADHGDSMTSHGLVTKHTSLYDETTRVPLMIAGPGVVGADRTIGGLASLLDVLPTLCHVAGIDAPPGLWGRSLMPWIQDAARNGSPHEVVMSQWHSEWGFTVEPGRMVRTERFKYTRYIEGGDEELFDMQADPGETRNRAAEESCKDALLLHRRLLEAFAAETADPFFSLSWQADARWRQHEPGWWNHRGPAAPMIET